MHRSKIKVKLNGLVFLLSNKERQEKSFKTNKSEEKLKRKQAFTFSPTGPYIRGRELWFPQSRKRRNVTNLIIIPLPFLINSLYFTLFSNTPLPIGNYLLYLSIINY
jgi:hypothetical protein